MIPCIEDKCILLPVCKSKSTIICIKLSDYMEFKTLKEIRQTLSEVRVVVKGEDEL